MAKAKESYEEWKKRKEQEGTLPASTTQRSATSAGSSYKPKESYEEWKARKEGKTSSNNLITSFLTDSRAYLSSAQKEYDSLNYQTGKSTYVKRITDAERLKARGRQIQQYIDRSGNSSEYADLKKYLEEFEKSADNVLDAFRSSADFYGQFESEDKYNEYVAYQKDRDEKSKFDIDAGQKEIASLEEELKELKRKRTLANSYQVAENAYLGSPYAAAQQGNISSESDDRISELEKLIAQKKQYLNQAKHIQEGITLSSVSGNADFEDNSGYVSTQSDSRWAKLTSDYGLGYEDLTYEYINNQDGIRDEIKQKHRTYSKNDDESMYEEKGYDYLTENEVAIFNYYYAKEGKDKAQEYLDSIQESLNLRKATGMYQNMEEKTLLELAFGVAAGLDQFESGTKNLFNTEDDYIPQTAKQMASGMVREDLSDAGPNLPTWLGGGSLGQAGYDVITTTANMAPSILASVGIGILNPTAGAYVGNALMGVSAAGNAYQEALNNGYDKTQARTYSTLIGASEAILGELLGGISSMGGTSKAITRALNRVDNAFLRFSGKMAGSMISEGFEEGLQEVLTPLLKNMIMHTDENIDFGEVVYSALLGALTAGILEGPTTFVGERNTYLTGKSLQENGVTAQSLADIGNKFSADTVAYQLAGRVNENTGAYTMGRLFNEIGATLTEQNINDITEFLVQKNMPEAIAKKNAQVLAAVVDGAVMSDAYIQIIEANEPLAQAVNKVIINPNSTVYQRTKGYNDALMALAKEMTAPTAAAAEQSLPGQENAATSDKVDVEKESGSEGEHEVSAEGKTILKSTGKTVNIREIAAFKDGKMMLRLSDGSTVEASEVSYASQDEALVYETVAQMGASVKAANILVNGFKYADSLSASEYAHGIEEAFRYGKLNDKSGLANSEFASKLNPGQQEYVYRQGQRVAGKQVAKDQATVSQKGNAATTEKTSIIGKVHFDRNGRTFDSVREVSLTTMEQLSKTLGVEFYVFESYINENGDRVYKDADGNEASATNGYYDPKDGSIHIDLNAGIDGKGTMLFTIAHELTHFIKQWSPAKFKVLANFLVKHYGEKDVSIDKLVDAQIAKAKKDGRKISREEAYEEMVADSMETILTDGNVVQMMADLKQQDRSLWQKICDWFKDLAADLQALVDAYKGVKPDSKEGKMVAQMQDVIVILESLYADALVEAGENYQVAKGQKNTNRGAGEVKHHARPSTKDPRFLDPKTVTKSDVVEMLRLVENGKIYGNTYFPVRINTPSKLIYWAFERRGDVIDNNPIAMSADKAYNAMNRSGETEKGRPNSLSVDELVAMIDAMNDPRYIVYQSENDRYVEVVEFNTESGDTAFAIIEIGNAKDAPYMNGYEGGLYNILVTTYPPKSAKKLRDLLNNPNNEVIYDKKKDASQRTSSSTVPSVLNDASFFDDSVPSNSDVVKGGFSGRDSDGNQLSKAEYYFENGKVREQSSIASFLQSARDREAEKLSKVLQKENDKLKEDVQYLKELLKLQRSVTNGTKFTKSSVEAAAVLLMKSANAKGDKKELAKLLDGFYSYIAKGEELTWEGVSEAAQSAVDWLQSHVETKKQLDAFAADVLQELRGSRIYLDETQKKEAAYKFGSYNEYRKKMMGTVIFTDNGSISLDSMWHELSSLYPSVFDPNTNATDMPEALMDAVDRLRNMDVGAYEYAYDDDMMAHDLIRQVYDTYWNVSTLKTVADVKQKEINRLKGEHINRMTKLKEYHKEKTEQLKKEHKEELKRVREEYRQNAKEQQQKIVDKYQESRKKAVAKVRETAEKREAREKLQKLVLDTAKWISHPAKTDVKFPDILKQPYSDFLNSIDMSSERLAKGGDPTKNDLRLANAMGSLATALEKIMSSQDPTQDTAAVLDAGYLDLPANFVKKLRDMTEDVKAMMIEGEYVVNTMTAEEVRKLSQMIRTLNHAIKEVSTLYANLRFANVEMLGDESMAFMDAIGEIQKTSGMKDFVQWENALPYYAFKRFGKGGESIFEGLMDAQDKLAFLAQKIFNFQEKTWKGDEAKKWSEDTHTIDLPDGEKLTLTTADAMSIYCLSRRQQGLQHLLGGGVRVMGIKKDSQKAKDSRSTLTIKDIDTIISSLTDRQKKVAEAIQEFMSTTCSEWGNEISMKRFLTKEFNEKFYFPIESNDENLPTKDPSAQQSDLFRLLNISATKAIDPRANNEVIIRNIFDVFTGHASDMARLNAFGLPLLDYMKWLNYREKTANEEGQIKVRGVRKYMETAYGNAAKSYVLNLIKDVNGRPSDNGDPSILMKWMRSAKTASVGSSLRVATLQLTSYPRAALVLSPKSLALGLTKAPNIEKAKKYCGIALWKSFGFYDTNISRSIEEQMKGVKDVKQKIIELSLKGAEIGDAITWGAMWNACEYEVASTKKYKVGSEEFYEAVGKKLREVVYRTQVVDSTLTRSQIMRSKRGMAQEAAAFMSEPTLSANILMDAGMEFSLEKRRTNAKTAWKKAGKYVTNALAVYSIGQLTAALLEGLWDAWRDDEDEEFGEKFVSAFKENLIMDLVPFNKIPIVSDVFEAVLAMFDAGYYSSDKMSTTWLTQAVSAADAWRDVIGGNSSVTTYNAMYKTMRALSSFYGVSASGVMREGVALWNNTAGAYDVTLKVLNYDRSKAELGRLLLDALVEGNDRQADSLRAEFEDEDAYQSALRSAIKERYLAGEIDTSTAQKYLVQYGGKDGSKAHWLTEEWMYESDSDEDFGKYNKFFDAVKTGKNLKAVIKEYTSNGVKPETLAGQITAHFKPEYMEMTRSEKASIKGYLLNAFEQCGVKREDAAKKLQHWEFLSEYPDSGLNQSQVDNYHEFAKTAGISAKVYIDYCHKAKGISKKEDLMDVIDSLPINSAQKDALYYAEGWAASKLNEAPWH